MSERFSTLSHLECTGCGGVHPADAVMGLCPACNKVLYARYDLGAATRTLTMSSLGARRRDMWRYHEVLPVRNPRYVLSLGEGGTPILPAPRVASRFGLKAVWLKDEGHNPTGTFKARGLSAATSRALELGVRAVAIPTAGNAGAALAAYAARGGLEAHIVMPQDTPRVNQIEAVLYGARVYRIDGLIDDAGRMVREMARQHGWYDVSTLREPYRLEGKKTMGYEIAEQLDWRLPDVIVYPTGGGTGLLGIWKAFEEMAGLGWIGLQRPRMVVVQAAGCAPIVRAFEAGRTIAERFEGAHTIASGLRVPAAVADYLILKTIRESEGAAVAVTDDELLAGVRDLAGTEGVFTAPEAAATVAALPHLYEMGALSASETVLLVLTGAGLKYTDVVAPLLPDPPSGDPR
jgi:threonine synthase